ncbi:MAG: TlpA family protein disulfide reductase [Bacteroidales bacterium]|nr:TlpA family protein disulfide reductase [Bacteroidales bacterium]
MKNYRIIAAAAALLALSSCQKTVITGTLKDAPGKEIIVGMLDVNRFQALDTLKTDDKGVFKYAPEVEKGCPEFIYFYYNEDKIASLLVEKGDRISVVADTLGNYTVEGSEESLLLQEAEQEYGSFLVKMDALGKAYTDGNAREIQQQMSRAYVEHYRKAVAYVMAHPFSLTSATVLFEDVSPGFPVFSQQTDALHFRSTADSLKKVYPDSKYVKALDREASRRMKDMEIQTRIANAEERGFMDIELPDINGRKVKLSDVDAKVTMVYFWATTDEQKMFNLDALDPLYAKYHSRGLEIFAVSLDIDKTTWASVVKNQNLPWINVCDIRGTASPYIGLYAVSALPRIVFIVDGMVDANPEITDDASLARYLEKRLK